VTSTARERDVTADVTPEAPRPTDEIVDVLIIGAGASGAAVAWSLAETRMKILCLEQGEWIKPTDFPSNGRDWEHAATPISTSAPTVARGTRITRSTTTTRL
jgi:choline dehydrogenase-like flavoprotein